VWPHFPIAGPVLLAAYVEGYRRSAMAGGVSCDRGCYGRAGILPHAIDGAFLVYLVRLAQLCHWTLWDGARICLREWAPNLSLMLVLWSSACRTGRRLREATGPAIQYSPAGFMLGTTSCNISARPTRIQNWPISIALCSGPSCRPRCGGRCATARLVTRVERRPRWLSTQLIHASRARLAAGHQRVHC